LEQSIIISKNEIENIAQENNEIIYELNNKLNLKEKEYNIKNSALSTKVASLQRDIKYNYYHKVVYKIIMIIKKMKLILNNYN